MNLIDYLNNNNIKYENTSYGLLIKSDLDLNNCTGLKSLPDGLIVKGSLDLEDCTGLIKLPDGLKVKGYLDLDGCTGLTSLPDGLQVAEYLYLNGCTLYSFDESKFKIYGDYNIIPNSYRFIIEDFTWIYSVI